MIESPPDGATPVTKQEFKGLIPTFVATRADLNLVEQAGIAAARIWVARSPAAHTVERVLSEQFVRDLHRKMYGKVWRWAGTYRSSESNIGVLPFTWGGADLDSAGPNRAAYLAALRRADRDPDDLDDLLTFARS